MGIDRHTLEFILDCKRNGVELRRTVTLGRQDVIVDNQSIGSLIRRDNVVCSDDQARRLVSENNGFAEQLLEKIGATSTDSIDKSKFEGASIIHDMNEALPKQLVARFDTVIDGGTLEHVFNVPQGIKNCMEMLTIGGNYIGINPCNNQFGHGFYQFSPEFYFRTFNAENGFEMRRMIYCETPAFSKWYEVSDPKEVQRRVTVNSMYPAYIMVWACKVTSAPLFRKTPQQSDYEAEWTNLPDKEHIKGRLDFFSKNARDDSNLGVNQWPKIMSMPRKILASAIERRYRLKRGMLPDSTGFTEYPRNWNRPKRP